MSPLTALSDKEKKFVMNNVTLISKSSEQQKDIIIYFTCRNISRHWEFFFPHNRSQEFVLLVSLLFWSTVTNDRFFKKYDMLKITHCFI